MNLSKFFRTSLIGVLSVLMTNIPNLALAQGGMISTSSVMANLDAAQEKQKLENYLNRGDVQKVLRERGISPDEMSARLASLSQQEVTQLTGQIEQAKAGGDILMAILVVVLIIFLIKRI